MLLIDYLHHRAFTIAPTVNDVMVIENHCKSLDLVCNAGYLTYSLQSLRALNILGICVQPQVSGNTTIVHLTHLPKAIKGIRISLEELLELLDMSAIYGLELGLEVFYQAWATKPGNLLFAGAYYEYEDRR